MTITEAKVLIGNKLNRIYTKSEIDVIVREIIGHLFDDDEKPGRWNTDLQINNEKCQQLESFLERLSRHEPLQYVLGCAWFYKRKFKVNKSVLIPRPETEELCEWILSTYQDGNRKIKLLDVGTGSGCIAITLSLENKFIDATAADISIDAITVADENAKNLGASIRFIKNDFLDQSTWHEFNKYDCIVSNPPYILFSEGGSINQNVIEFEPHEALFVTNNDPLQFYKMLLEFGKSHLAANGTLFMECHQHFAEMTSDYFIQGGFNTELRVDMSGNLRMLKARRS